MRKRSNPAARGILPPPRPLPTEWAEKNFYLSQGATPEPGYYRSDRAPYQAGIINSQYERGIKTTVFVSSTQVGKSLALLLSIAYVIAVNPGPALMVQPTTQMAEEFSRERLMLAIRDSPALRKKIDMRGRSAANTLLKKEFPGGYFALTGANSATGLAARTIQFLYLDEIDRYPLSVSRDADPVAQVLKRTANFWNAKIWQVSTPTLTKSSRILKLWETSDKRRYFVPCPHCGQKQHLVWEQIKYPGKGTPEAQPDQAYYECLACSKSIPDSFKSKMLALGEWAATEPNPKKPGTAGFHLNELYSPWRAWSDVALDFEIARLDPLQLQVWTNTSLGLGWDADDTEQLQWEALAAKAELSTYERGQVPDAVSMLTAGVDVQGDRVEVSVWGWGEGEGAYLIDHQAIAGEPTTNATWEAVEDYLQGGFVRGDLLLVPKCTFVDSGNWTKEIYAQVKKRKALNWHAIKGKGGDRVLISTPTIQEVDRRGGRLKSGVKLRILGVDLAKDTLYSRLNLADDHPKRLQFPAGMDLSYFEGLASEIKIKRHRAGQSYYIWDKLPGVYRNEPLDCAVYAYCAAVLAGLERNNWQQVERRLLAENKLRLKLLSNTADDQPAAVEAPQPTNPTAKPKPARAAKKNWATDI